MDRWSQFPAAQPLLGRLANARIGMADLPGSYVGWVAREADGKSKGP
jgi:hypothetical protein